MTLVFVVARTIVLNTVVDFKVINGYDFRTVRLATEFKRSTNMSVIGYTATHCN